MFFQSMSPGYSPCLIASVLKKTKFHGVCYCQFISYIIINISIIAHGPATPILNWNVVQLKSSWGVLILIGGGYAIADASDSSGFSGEKLLSVSRIKTVC